jgi:hypothetical protein
MYCDKCECTFEDKGLNKVRHRTGRCTADPDRVHAAVEKANEVEEPMETNETFYLVEYATHATYYKVDNANSYEDACDLIGNGNTDEGIVTIDRSDVFIDYTDKDIYDMVKQKNDAMRVRS